MENECGQKGNNMRIFEWILIVGGILLFLFGMQLQTFTNTNLDYRVLGAFIFLAGLVVYWVNAPKKRRR